MKIEKVKKLSPLARFLYWVREREAIRVRRAEGKPRPWTDDVILDTYRFCNVRRMDDKVSQWLLENWYKPNFDHPNMLAAVALARFINKPESLDIVEFPYQWNPDRIKQKLRAYREEGATIFNGAYMVRGNDGIDKIECVVDYYVQPLVDKPPLIHRDSMELTHAELVPYYGFGSFMAGQVVADLRWAMKGDWSDRLRWAPIGPGSKRGMNRLLGRAVNNPMSQEEFEGHLGDLGGAIAKDSPTIYKRLEAQDIQSCCCEWDKYERTLWGEGRPKQLFRSER